MDIYLVDGTYELFRHYYAVPSRATRTAARWARFAVCSRSLLGMMKEGATHIAVATDHVIESFRNDLWRGYKTGEGVDADLLDAVSAAGRGAFGSGVVVWPMVEFEADDALAAAAAQGCGGRAGGAGDHLHARQGPGAMRARHARGAIESPHAGDLR